MLELHNAQGGLVAGNDNWRENGAQAAALQTAGMNPKDYRESANRMSLPAGSYTAVVKGKNGSIGVALVEAYQQ